MNSQVQEISWNSPLLLDNNSIIYAELIIFFTLPKHTLLRRATDEVNYEM